MQRIQQKAVITTQVVLNAFDCPSCGVVFGITEEFEARRRTDGAVFYCPSGHVQVFGPTREALLRKEIDALREEKAALTSDNVRLSNDLMDAAKEAKRLKRRGAAGMCDVCRRTFANKERHMSRQHPEFVKAAKAAAST